MDSKQIEWICSKCNSLIAMSKERNFHLSESDWETVLSTANKYTAQAKGNSEVKKALVATITYIETMNKIVGEQ